jgi:hypothetical protein
LALENSVLRKQKSPCDLSTNIKVSINIGVIVKNHPEAKIDELFS